MSQESGNGDVPEGPPADTALVRPFVVPHTATKASSAGDSSGHQRRSGQPHEDSRTTRPVGAELRLEDDDRHRRAPVSAAGDGEDAAVHRRAAPAVGGRRNRRAGLLSGRRGMVAAVAVVAVVAGLPLLVSTSSDGDRRRALPPPVPWTVPSADYGVAPRTGTQSGIAPGSGSASTVPSRSVTAGAATGSPPASTAAPGAAAKPAPRQPVRFTAVSGEGCQQNAASGYHRSGWHDDWYSKGSGGWSRDGCNGRVVSVPMSGSASRDDDSNVVVWWFRTTGIQEGTCTLQMYVPDTGNRRDAAGKPAHYLVFGSASPDSSPLSAFDVDQAANQGRWVTGTQVTLTGGQFSVRMVTRGIDWGAGHEGDHLGVSAAKADCRERSPG